MSLDADVLAARLGARITPHFALEAHYEWMDDFETSIDGIEVAETRTQAMTGDVKGYLSTGRVQPYLSVGLGFLSAKSDDPVTTFQKTDTDFAARFGGGVDFYLNESFGLSIDSSYVVPTGDVEDLLLAVDGRVLVLASLEEDRRARHA